MIKFKVDIEKNKELEDALVKGPKNIEEKINEFLHIKGVKLVMQSIIGFMPISDRKNKKHAKTSDSLKGEDINLGFVIKARGTLERRAGFAYLIFPNEGIGKKNPIAQQFFQKGLEREQEKIYENIFNIIKKEMEK